MLGQLQTVPALQELPHLKRDSVFPVVLQRNPELILISVLMGLASSVLAVAWARKRGAPSGPTVLFALALTVVLTSTLIPISKVANGSGYCTLPSSWDGMLDDSGMLNVALFVPLGFFSTLILRRASLAIVGAITLSAAIELCQALIPMISRRCDSSDFLANSLGATIGVAIAFGIMRHIKAEYNICSVRKLWATLGCAVCTIGIIGGVGLDWHPSSTASSVGWVEMGESDQRRGKAIVYKLLGRDVRVDSIRLMNDVNDGVAKSVAMVQFDGGILYIDWSSGEPFHAEFGTSIGQRPLDLLAPISDSVEMNEKSAAKRAQEFVRNLAWPNTDKAPKASANGDASQGFIVSWREREGGVLLPFRLDVLIGPTGEVTGFDGNPIQLSSPLPPVRVGENEAKSIATSKVSDHKIGSVELLAEQVEGTWIPVWAIGLTSDGSSLGNQDRWVVVIDATKPRIIRTIDPSGSPVVDS
ncbi:VanZ family protein [Sphaerimonospora sp. CA-214678]|uniref:VanZ family protein n=1 Tax=Sphaerimonospora sp. CA-214678 TaxID=3240029 RepID=UPI003D8B9E10